MGKVIFWLVDTPAQIIGALLAQFWPIAAAFMAIGCGVVLYRLIEDRMHNKIALAISIVLGVYTMTVMYQTEKWLALSLLTHYHNPDGDDDY
jgi:hypothetical protein